MGSFRQRRDGTFRDISAFPTSKRDFLLASIGFDWVRFVVPTPGEAVVFRLSKSHLVLPATERGSSAR
jgi:hypothetical protein